MPTKRQIMKASLKRGRAVEVYLDPRFEDVVLPPQHLHEPSLLLRYVQFQIPDLLATGDGISATLSFQSKRYWTFIPWRAVFAIAVDGERDGVMWEGGTISSFSKEQAVAPVAKPSRPALQVLDGGMSGEAGVREPSEGKRPWLRLVKSDDIPF